MNFPDGTINYDLVWFGEIHGIKENYLAYKKLLPQLANLGFKTILWEMPADFSSTSQYTEDGRINSYAIEFLEWIHSQIKTGVLENIILFGNRKPQTKNGVTDYEKVSSEELLEIVNHDPAKKYVVVSGNYHMDRLKQRQDETKRCIDYIESESELKILTVKVRYSGGTFYNHGLKQLSPSSISNSKTPEEGGFELTSEDANSGTLDLRVGEAHAVFENPTTR